jgi:hypothetical protein
VLFKLCQTILLFVLQSTFHNLCKNIKLPTDTKALLGLNLKYCLANNTINQDINKTLLKMAYSIQTKFQLEAIGHTDNSNFEPQIYTKNKSWNPDPAPLNIKEKLTEFGKALYKHQQYITQKHTGRNLNNLTPSQLHVLKLLRHNKHLTIKATDKNLGPAIMETKDYINQVLTEHLLTKDYKQLSTTEAKNILDKVKNTLKNS